MPPLPDRPAGPTSPASSPTPLDFTLTLLTQAGDPGGLLENHSIPAQAAPDLIQARSDIEAAAIWLETLENPKTRRAARKEIERFLLWSRHTHGKPLAELTVTDIRRYQRFISDPQPETVWVSRTRYSRSHPYWRPFAGPLSAVSQRYALQQINSLMKWLVAGGWLKGNPVGLVKKPTVVRDRAIKRLLPHEGIALAFEAIQRTGNPLKRARDHFMFSLFYLTGLRTFEASAVYMSSIRLSASGQRWLEVLGKRSKRRSVPVSEALYQDLLAYRKAFGLPDVIRPDERVPLILAANSKLKRASDSTILKAIQHIMKGAAQLALEKEMPELASRLGEASTHWLRHSCLSHLAKETGDLVMVKTLAGHEKLETTSLYLHTEDEQLHRDVVNTLMTPRLLP
ncbi:integrase [Pseudomonas luteola]|uniref:tyrosine-type recombinase/integrase n=1 Tax=Pseudomonas luteola TaxID=47886 RepID=UPI000F785801|nr:tyrosine-type recombinase/integrase [Pseudomonas luteola]RRW40022.1 integrase [Pseudomonas luteola]